MRFFPILLLACLALPASLADTPAPNPFCQEGGEALHHYLPPNAEYVLWAHDGGMGDCRASPLVTPLWPGPDGPCADAPGTPLLCESVGENPFDYDGELDHGFGGVLLFVETGDGHSSGALACYGAPSAGHHGTTVSVDEYAVTAWAPGLTAWADHSRPIIADAYPDCGDGYMEPCDATPPPPSRAFFPLNVAEDAARALLVQALGQGTSCNPFDRAYACRSVGRDVNTCAFGPPGVDGALAVFVTGEPGLGRTPVAGHVWS